VGASVTIPHKINALDLADELDEEARNAKSVNTLYLKDGIWRGANTDIAAIATVTKKLGGRSGQKAAILGTGGFARAAAWALADLGIIVTLLGRSPIEDVGPWEDCLPVKALKDLPFQILFNATPVGGREERSDPVPEEVDLRDKIVLDGVLAGRTSPLVERALASKARVGAGAVIWAEQGSRQLDLFRCPPAKPRDLEMLARKVGGIAAVKKQGRKRRQGRKS